MHRKGQGSAGEVDAVELKSTSHDLPTTSSLNMGDASNQQLGSATQDDNGAMASWASLPKKRQLTLLAFARFCETVANSSLQSYIFFQLRSFKQPDGSAPSTAALALQVSVLNAAVAGPQLFTSILWGRMADSPRLGRKFVVLVGLVGTGVGSLGFGFTSSFAVTVPWRLLVGLANSNKGVMRTMVKEIGGDKFESRAILLLPMAFNFGSMIGPVMGGLLADPAAMYPSAFGPGGFLEIGKGPAWLSIWPYALPNVLNGMGLIACAALLAFRLEETLPGVKCQPTSILSQWVKKLFQRRSQSCYEKLIEQGEEEEEEEEESIELDEQGQSAPPKAHNKHHSGRIWTRRLGMTLLARGLMVLHIASYQSLLLWFISTPRYSPEDGNAPTGEGIEANATVSASLSVPPDYHPHAPFTFTGGLSFRPGGIATALVIRGFLGLMLQLLFFPLMKRVFGTVKLYRYALLLFPVSYFLTPYLATITSSTPPPLPADGVLLWTIIALILTVQATARAFALPSGNMLLNATSPDRSMLGTVNGIGQSVSAAATMVGPVLTGWLYGVGLRNGIVGTAWWAMVIVAVSAAVAGAHITT